MILISALFLFFVSLKFISCGIIIPDPQNPILMLFPNKDLIGNNLIFRFSLPPDSIGLLTTQFIGVKFPSNMNTIIDLTLKPNVPFNQFTCNLTDDTGRNYTVTPYPTNDNETTFFCRYEETQVNLVASGKYKLQIGLTQLSFNLFPYVRQVGIFTSTSNTYSKIFIDNNPVFGDIVSFPDWGNVMKPDFNISDTQITGGTVKMGSTFDVVLTVKLNNFFTPDNIFMLKLPADTVVSGPLTITSQRGDLNNIAGEIASPIVGNLTLIPFGPPQTYLITGITDTKMIPGRYFRLTFTSITVNDFIPPPIQNNPNAADKYLEIWIFYPNSYTIISFSKALLCSFKTVAITNFVISHPSNTEHIYSGSVWPFHFSFQSPNDFKNGGYVVIRHTDSVLNIKKLNFIPSTCDFSDNNSPIFNITDNPGSRPICFPLRNNFNYKGASTTNQFEGSGFAFKLPTIKSGEQFNVTIFAFVENCGMTYGLTGNNIFTNFNFGLRIFRSMNMNFLHEDRFNGKGTALINLFAESSVEASLQKCWPAYNGNGQILEDSISYVSNDIIIHKDITDFRLGIVNSNHVSSCTNCFFNDMKNPSNSVWNDGGIYSTQNSLSNSYLAIRMDFKLADTAVSTNYVRNVIPNFVYGIGGNTPISGQVRLEMQPDYFVKGDENNCYMTWGLVGYTISGKTNNYQTTSQTMLINSSNNPSIPATGYTDPLTKNFIPALNIVANTTTNYGMESSYPKYENDYIAIQSKIDLMGSTYFKFLTDGGKTVGLNTQYFTFGLYSSCVKYVTTFPDFTSPFDYFEVKLLYVSQISLVNSVDRSIRFFKFVTDLGIIDPTNYSSSKSGGVTFHTTYFSSLSTSNTIFPNLYHNAVCLIQINNKDIFDFKNTSNTLLIYINNLMLLDNDYSDLSSNYPIVPKIPAISFNSNPFYIGYYPSVINGVASPVTMNYYTYYVTSYVPKIPRTIAYNFAGPIVHLNFSKLTKESFNSDILIPTFCPLQSGVNTVNANIPANPFYSPLVTVAWNTSRNENLHIDSVDRIIVPNSSDSNFGYFMPSVAAQIRNLPNSFPINTSIRFNSYSSSDSSKLFIIGNPPTQSSPNPANLALSYNCSGFSFLFTKFIKYGTMFNLYLNVNLNNLADTQSPVLGNTGLYTSTLPFYYLGKQYYGFLGISLPQPSGMVNPGFTNFITGFTRPLLEEYIVNDGKNVYLESLDKLAFHCTSSGLTSNDTTYFTNFNNNIQSINTLFEKVGSFVIDWFPDNITPWGTPTFGADVANQQVFKNDFGGNFNIGINLPSGAYLIPIATAIRIQINSNSTLFNKNTVCAMKSLKDPYSINCQLTNSNYTNSLDCGTASQSSSFQICCYNVFMGYSDPIYLPRISLIYSTNNPNYIGLSDNLWSEVSTLPNSAGIIYNTGNARGKDIYNEIDLNISPIIESVSYEFYQQTNSYDKVNFKIRLPRPPLPKSYLKATETTGNFKDFFITFVNTKCRALFTNSKKYADDLGNFMIESCAIYNNAFQINFKSLIRNCNTKIGKYIYVSLWPVKSINLYEIQLQFYVDMKLTETNDHLAKNLQPFPPLYTGNDILFSPINQYVDNAVFLSVDDVFPRIIGETADYYFIVNSGYLDKKYIPSETPNEIMMFFNHDYYNLEESVITDQIMCFHNNSKENCKISVPCKIVENNVMILSFKGGIQYTSSFYIRICGVQNPQSLEDIRFLYSYNYFDFSSGRRKFLINGSDTLKPIVEPASMAAYGPLRILTSSFSSLTPKSFSSKDNPFRIRIGFDNSLNPTMIPNTISGNPVLIISFPYPDFYLLYMYNIRIEAQVKMFSFDSFGNLVEGSEYFDQSVKILGNKIQIALSNSITLGSSFLYFDTVLYGIPTPIDAVNLTSRLKVGLINNSVSNVYRCYSNNYVIRTLKMENPIDFYIQYYRGFNFKYNQVNKFILDITQCSSKINEIIIKSGIISTCLLNLRSISKSDFKRNYNTTLTMNDPFKLFTIENNLIYFSTTQLAVTFRIGINDYCQSGRYWVNFDSTDVENFYPIPPIIIYVDTESKGTYQITKFPFIPDEGRIKFSILLSNYTSNLTVFKFYGNGYNSIDPSIDITDVVIPKYSNYGDGYVKIQGSGVKGDQVLSIYSSNTYFNLTNRILGFTVQGKIPDFPSNFNESKAFTKFENGDSNNIKKNQYQFKFTPPIAHMDLHCVFICFNLKFPTNDEMINRTFVINEGPLFNYSFYQFVDTKQTNILIQNLVRGRSYKLKCLLQTVESDISARKNRTVTFNTIPGTLSEIKTSQKNTIKFLEFYFIDNPGPEAIISFLSFCQKTFISYSDPSNTNPSCIYCVDNSGNSLPGLKLTNSNITTCPGESSNVFRRFLSDHSSYNSFNKNLQAINNTFKNPDLENKNNLNTLMRYRFFIIQDLLCDTNTIDGKEVDTYISNLVNDSNDTSILNKIHSNLSEYFVNFTFKTEDKYPVIDFKILNYSFSPNGSYLFNITNNNKSPDYSVDCFWAIMLSNNVTPSFDTIEGCTNYLWCGRNIINTNYTVIKSSDTNLLPFSKGYVYNLWMACYNNIPFAILKGNVTYVVGYNLSYASQEQGDTMSQLPQPIPFLNFSDPNLSKLKNNIKLANFQIEIIIFLIIVLLF